ncbi:MAG TPA: Rab family GTPase [Candidatus Deferrimicrobium sp.]|nr:Rab family GTPase [Candidatus Deferrimicrobium sp.]
MSKTFHYKIIVVGDGGVGKTTLILKYTEKRFRESYISTIGVQWTVKEVNYEGKEIKLIIWDVGGQEIYKKIRTNFYEEGNAAIIVFDLTDPGSFDHVETWMKEVQTFCGAIPFILLGNKLDLIEQRKVEREEVQTFIQKYNIPYFETSAKTGENVVDLFNNIIKTIH